MTGKSVCIPFVMKNKAPLSFDGEREEKADFGDIFVLRRP